MGIDSLGNVVEVPHIRAGYIGCGSHSRRNVIPAMKFTPSIETVAICDLNKEKAEAFAKEFGFEKSYTSHIEMLEKEKLDAVFIVTNYDRNGRPIYPQLAKDCLEHGCNVFIEKPPAASSEELVELKKLAEAKNLKFMVGLKKMFGLANVKAKELSQSAEFGGIALATIQYPQYIPPAAEIKSYVDRTNWNWDTVGFLDHLCHPLSLMLLLMGHPESFNYARTSAGSGVAYFNFPNGSVCSLALTNNAASNGGMEYTQLFANKMGGGHIVVENNIRVSYRRTPPDIGYGATPSYFMGTAGETTAMWEPEFSLGQLYNKGLFLLGYYGEVEEFAQSVIQNKFPEKGNLDDAIVITRIFEGFAQGANKNIIV